MVDASLDSIGLSVLDGKNTKWMGLVWSQLHLESPLLWLLLGFATNLDNSKGKYEGVGSGALLSSARR